MIKEHSLSPNFIVTIAGYALMSATVAGLVYMCAALYVSNQEFLDRTRAILRTVTSYTPYTQGTTISVDTAGKTITVDAPLRLKNNVVIRRFVLNIDSSTQIFEQHFLQEGGIYYGSSALATSSIDQIQAGENIRFTFYGKGAFSGKAITIIHGDSY